MKKTTLYLTRGSLCAALYVVLTLLSAAFGLSSGAIQFRISEALCVLPIFFPEAVPALVIGCLLANLLTQAVIWDVIFGSLATLIGALGARMLRNTRHLWLVPLPTVLANVLIVSPVVVFFLGGGGALSAIPLVALGILVGELVCAEIGGIALIRLIKKTRLLRY